MPQQATKHGGHSVLLAALFVEQFNIKKIKLYNINFDFVVCSRDPHVLRRVYSDRSQVFL